MPVWLVKALNPFRGPSPYPEPQQCCPERREKLGHLVGFARKGWMRSRALSYHPLCLDQSLLHTLLGSSVLSREVVICFLSLPNFFGLWVM